ncbi:MAG: Ig domain-containing protein, partial [Acutalibacteraceae bacterium]
MKKIISLLLVCLLAFTPCVCSAVSCDGETKKSIRLVVPEDWEMDIGDSRSVEGVFSDSVSNRVLSWSAEPQSVATVDEWGRVTAVGEGKATITAQNSDGLKDSVTLTVVQNATKGVTNKAKHDYALGAVDEVENLQKIVDRYAKSEAQEVPAAVKNENNYTASQKVTTADGAVWEITNYGVLRTDENAPTDRDKQQRFMGDRYFYSADTGDGKVLAIFPDGANGIWTVMAE